VRDLSWWWSPRSQKRDLGRPPFLYAIALGHTFCQPRTLPQK
jgi:hypothetical protein